MIAVYNRHIFIFSETFQLLWKRPDIVHSEIIGAGERSQSSTVIGMRATRYRSSFDKIRNIHYSKGVFMIREENRGKVVSYLRKRGATVVLWIPIRKEKKLLELQVT
ncbi:MAG: hypothetical protein QXN95_03035 [Candidatus Bathyarchaeia archaeon]